VLAANPPDQSDAEPGPQGHRTQEEMVSMYAYQCRSCGGLAYTSANAATVGACPHCSAPLGSPLPPGEPASERRPSPRGGGTSERAELSLVHSNN